MNADIVAIVLPFALHESLIFYLSCSLFFYSLFSINFESIPLLCLHFQYRNRKDLMNINWRTKAIDSLNALRLQHRVVGKDELGISTEVVQTKLIAAITIYRFNFQIYLIYSCN